MARIRKGLATRKYRSGNLVRRLRKGQWIDSPVIAIPDLPLEYLIVAGGGGGAGRVGGGGGAGGLITGTITFDPTKTYQVTVGRGGLGTSSDTATAQPGFDSVFDTFTAIGGGGGGGQEDPPMNGGSGAGERGNSGNGGGIGVPGQGFNGGEYILITSGGNNYRSGAGGGAGEKGGDGSAAGPAKGGDGLQSAITGVNQYYAGGGGGSQFINAAGGQGGFGGGGNGGPVGITDGADGFGGGGGGGGSVGQTDYKGGDGGDGSVRLAAPDTALSRSTTIITSNLFGDWLTTRPGFGVPRFTGGAGSFTGTGGDNPVDMYRRAYWVFSGQYNSDDPNRPAGSFRRLLDNATRTNVTAGGLGNLLKWAAGGDVYASSVGGQEDSNIRAVNGIAAQQPRVVVNGAYPAGRYALLFDGNDDVLTTFTTAEVARYFYLVFTPSVTITPASSSQYSLTFGNGVALVFGSATQYLNNEIITLLRGGSSLNRDGISGAVIPELTAGVTYTIGVRVDAGSRAEMFLAGGGFDGLTDLRDLQSGDAGAINITNIDLGNTRAATGIGYSGYALEGGVYTTAETFADHSRMLNHCRQKHQF